MTSGQSERERLVDDAVDRWHDSTEAGVPLHRYLGWTWDEYAHWAKTAELPPPREDAL